jgi:hypothetical protein
MAIEHIAYIKIKCDGPCGSESTRVSKIPSDWRKVKVYLPSVPQGTKPVETEMLLCPECHNQFIGILKMAYFNIER